MSSRLDWNWGPDLSTSCPLYKNLNWHNDCLSWLDLGLSNMLNTPKGLDIFQQKDVASHSNSVSNFLKQLTHQTAQINNRNPSSFLLEGKEEDDNYVKQFATNNQAHRSSSHGGTKSKRKDGRRRRRRHRHNKTAASSASNNNNDEDLGTKFLTTSRPTRSGVLPL